MKTQTHPSANGDLHPVQKDTSGRAWLAGAAFAVGLVLLGLNLLGVLIPLRDPDLAKERETEVRPRPLLSESEFYERIERGAETDADYAVKLTQAVNEGLIHYRPVVGHLQYHWNVPIYENYLLWLSRQAVFARRWIQRRRGQETRPPEEAFIYEFSSPRKAIERGVGLCSQHAVVLMGFLKAHGIPARYVGLTGPNLGGHVVVEAEVDQAKETRWILDADYGVVVREDVRSVQQDPEIARRYYEQAGYDSETVNLVMAQYHGDNVFALENVQQAHGRVRYDFEFASYYVIWVIPGFLMLPLSIRCARRLVCRNRKGGPRPGTTGAPTSQDGC